MDRLRQALDTHHELCDAFDAYLLAETDEDAVGKRSWLAHRFINGGEKAMHALAEAAQSVLDAPRIWRCWENIVIGPPLEDADWTPHLQQPSSCKPENGHHGCGWVRVVDDPQEGEQ